MRDGFLFQGARASIVEFLLVSFGFWVHMLLNMVAGLPLGKIGLGF